MPNHHRAAGLLATAGLLAGLLGLTAHPTTTAETPEERCRRETQAYNAAWRHQWESTHPDEVALGHSAPPPPTTSPTNTTHHPFHPLPIQYILTLLIGIAGALTGRRLFLEATKLPYSDLNPFEISFQSVRGKTLQRKETRKKKLKKKRQQAQKSGQKAKNSNAPKRQTSQGKSSHTNVVVDKDNKILRYLPSNEQTVIGAGQELIPLEEQQRREAIRKEQRDREALRSHQAKRRQQEEDDGMCRPEPTQLTDPVSNKTIPQTSVDASKVTVRREQQKTESQRLYENVRRDEEETAKRTEQARQREIFDAEHDPWRNINSGQEEPNRNKAAKTVANSSSSTLMSTLEQLLKRGKTTKIERRAVKHLGRGLAGLWGVVDYKEGREAGESREQAGVSALVGTATGTAVETAVGAAAAAAAPEVFIILIGTGAIAAALLSKKAGDKVDEEYERHRARKRKE